MPLWSSTEVGRLLSVISTVMWSFSLPVGAVVRRVSPLVCPQKSMTVV